MRTLAVFFALLAATAMSSAAFAQQKAAPSKAQGAGAECSRMTDAKARDECVRQAQQKRGQSQNDSRSGKSSNMKNTERPGKSK